MQTISVYDIKENLEDEAFISRFFDGNEISVCIQYESEFPNAKILREFVDKVSKISWINPKWRTRLVLIVDELNNNAIEYGSNPKETNCLSLFITRSWDQDFFIDISVTDSWMWEHAKNSNEMEEMRKRHENKDFAQHNSIRGRGLFLIISKLVDTLYFKDSPQGWLQVGFEKSLSLSD